MLETNPSGVKRLGTQIENVMHSVGSLQSYPRPIGTALTSRKHSKKDIGEEILKELDIEIITHGNSKLRKYA